MIAIWQRWRRLWRQSEIRLSPVDTGIEPGDRVQIGPRLWRVTRRLPDGTLELASADAVARLRHHPGAACPWRLVENDVEMPVAARDLLCFPIAAARD